VTPFATPRGQADRGRTPIELGQATKKQQDGKDLIILGSSDLAASLADQGLVDEFRIMVSPVVLGEGKPVLNGIKTRLKLKLLSARTFGNGNVLLSYAPAAKVE
jgi:dihydrofolate reductase